MFAIDFKSRKSISDQIVDNFKELIVSGVLKPEDRIPSVRELAGEITVNPNTVQKAYHVLEQQGYIYTSRGRGTFVSDSGDGRASDEDVSQGRSMIKDGLDKLYYAGLTKEDAKAMLEELIDRREGWK